MTPVNPTVYGNSSSTSQQFCLKWNNHTANIVKSLTEMMLDDSFVDVTLACDGSSMKAHKVVLSACSNYFKELFLTNPCKHPIVILKDMRLDDLKAIVNFMYKGEVNVSQNQLGALLKTAEILKVKGLTEVNEDSNKNGLNETIGTTGTEVCNETDVGQMNSETSSTTTTTTTNYHSQSVMAQNPIQPVMSGDVVQSTGQSNNRIESPTVRKKRRRRNKTNSGTEADAHGSGGESSSGSEVDDDSSECPSKRSKELDVENEVTMANRSNGSSQSTPSPTTLPASISPAMMTPTPSTSGIQTRRRAMVQKQIQQRMDKNDISEESGDDSVHNHNPDGWQNNNISLMPGEEIIHEDDEEEEVIDVKPIISFDEGSSESQSLSNQMVINDGTEDGSNNQILALTPCGSTSQVAPGTGKVCVCHLCHLTFTAYSSLRRHMARHYADRERYECEICYKSYSRKDYLKEHKKLKHSAG